MDPEVEIEQAISEARAADQRLRNQAAKVIAHRTQLEAKIERAAAELGEAREMAKQALLKAEEAKNNGDTAAFDKWTTAAQSLALKIQAAESNVNGLKEQYEIALQQAEDAKAGVQQNAMRLQELAAKRMQLLGKLEQARMQELLAWDDDLTRWAGGAFARRWRKIRPARRRQSPPAGVTRGRTGAQGGRLLGPNQALEELRRGWAELSDAKAGLRQAWARLRAAGAARFPGVEAHPQPPGESRRSASAPSRRNKTSCSSQPRFPSSRS